jgi:hypothetical protein
MRTNAILTAEECMAHLVKIGNTYVYPANIIKVVQAGPQGSKNATIFFIDKTEITVPLSPEEVAQTIEGFWTK